MQRLSVNYLIDLITLLALLPIACTGLIMRFALPPGSGGARRVLWGLGRHEWGSVHFWITVAAAAIIALHLFLHWTWVCTVTARLLHPRTRVPPPTRLARRSMAGVLVAALASLLVGFTLLAHASVQTSESAADRHERQGSTDPAGPGRGGRRAIP